MPEKQVLRMELSVPASDSSFRTTAKEIDSLVRERQEAELLSVARDRAAPYSTLPGGLAMGAQPLQGLTA